MTIDRMPYVKALYQAVTDQPWDISVYTKDKFDAAVYRGMSSTFNYGSLHFERAKQPVAADSSDAAKAFAYFNKAVDRDLLCKEFDATVAAINDGRHPVANSAFIKVGSQMAHALSKKYSRERMNRFHLSGAIPFFSDYIAMYKANSRYPADLRFNRSFEELVERWNQDWARTWNDYTRRFDFTAGSDLNDIEKNLVPLFARAEVYPNLINQLLDLRQSFEAKKDFQSAAHTARIAAELYPQSDRANVFYGISLTLVGSKDEARNAMRKAAAISSSGIASSAVFNRIALAMDGAAKLDAAIAWLEIATEIYPKDANLFGTLGDLYKKSGRQDQAVDAYKKALAIDPNFEKAKANLKQQPE